MHLPDTEYQPRLRHPYVVALLLTLTAIVVAVALLVMPAANAAGGCGGG